MQNSCVPSRKMMLKRNIYDLAQNIFICDARGVFLEFVLSINFSVLRLIGTSTSDIKEHKKTSYSDMTLYLCLKWSLLSSNSLELKFNCCKRVGVKSEYSTRDLKACLFFSWSHFFQTLCNFNFMLSTTVIFNHMILLILGHHSPGKFLRHLRKSYITDRNCLFTYIKLNS